MSATGADYLLPSRIMSYAVWILQFLLAFTFVAAGLTKLVSAKAKLKERMAWAGSVDSKLIKLIGALELLGGLGLLLPPIATVLPTVLTLIATIGLGVMMVGAIALHIRLHEVREAMPALVLLLFLILLAFGLFAADRV